MNITLIGASDMFARGFAAWAVAAGHNVTIVGFNPGQAEQLVNDIHADRAAVPGDPLLDNVISLAMPFNCVLDARDFYGKQLDNKIVIDVTLPIDFETAGLVRRCSGRTPCGKQKHRDGSGHDRSRWVLWKP